MSRVYVVETDEELTLVKAGTQSQALNHVVKGQFQVRVATAMDVLDYMNQGGVVEDARADKASADEAEDTEAEDE